MCLEHNGCEYSKRRSYSFDTINSTNDYSKIVLHSDTGWMKKKNFEYKMKDT